MNTKLFVGYLNQITKTLFSMTPAQRERVHQSIQALSTEMGADELIQPLFDALSQCPHCHSNHLKNGGSLVQYNAIVVKIA